MQNKSNFSVASLHRSINEVFIDQKSNFKQQAFSKQKTGQKSQNFLSFVRVFSVLSGGDEVSLLMDFFQKTSDGERILKTLTQKLWSPMEKTMGAIKQQMDADSENSKKKGRGGFLWFRILMLKL